jgi:ankyrin repeat protein
MSGVEVSLYSMNTIRTIRESGARSRADLSLRRSAFLCPISLGLTFRRCHGNLIGFFRHANPYRRLSIAHGAAGLCSLAFTVVLIGCYANPLIEAAREGNVSEVTRLLDSGADVNAVDSEGWSPLIAASWAGHLKVVRILLERGADVHARDGAGETALMAAATKGRVEIVKALLEKGANANAKDKDGTTPLMRAAWKGYLDVVKLLLDKGADVNARNSAGATALTYATESGIVKVRDILLEHGAKK